MELCPSWSQGNQIYKKKQEQVMRDCLTTEQAFSACTRTGFFCCWFILLFLCSLVQALSLSLMSVMICWRLLNPITQYMRGCCSSMSPGAASRKTKRIFQLGAPNMFYFIFIYPYICISMASHTDQWGQEHKPMPSIEITSIKTSIF